MTVRTARPHGYATTTTTRRAAWPGSIRLATDEDGSAIGKLFIEAGMPDHGLDWSQGLGSWWVVGERDGRIVGAILAIPSRPLAYIAELVVHPSEQGGRLGKTLLALAVTMFDGLGIEMVAGFVCDDRPGWERFTRFKRAGLFPLYLRRLR